MAHRNFRNSAEGDENFPNNVFIFLKHFNSFASNGVPLYDVILRNLVFDEPIARKLKTLFHGRKLSNDDFKLSVHLH